METTTYNTSDCCGETQPTNPKTDLFPRKKKRDAYGMFGIKNPIVDEVADTQELKRFFKRWPYVPYAGTTNESGHRLLVWYQMLAKLSATHGACIAKKIEWAFGGKAMFERSVDSDWQTSEDARPMSTAEEIAYRDALKEFFVFEGGVGKLHMDAGRSLEENGNAFLEMTYAETLGVGRVSVKWHKTANCMYLNTEAGEARVVAISPVWSEKYIEKKPPRLVPLFPNFGRSADGSLKTMFHLKTGENSWYGRPESQNSDIYKYREVQDGLYLVRQAGANFTGQLIIEVEDDDSPAIEEENAKKAGFDSFAERFEQNYTNKSDDPQSVLVTARPFGSRPMFVFQVAPNTNENWYKVTGEIAEQKIVRSHKCTLRFMSFDVSNGFSTDAFLSDYVINMEPTINALRERVTNMTNQIVTEGWKLLGKEQFAQYAITFAPPIKTAVSEYKNRNATAQNGIDNPV